MNIAEKVAQAHAGLAGDRIYPNKFPQEQDGGPVWPAIRYTIAQDAEATICGSDTGDTDDFRVQVDYVAEGYDDGKALRDAAVVAMQELDPPCVRVGGLELWDEETKTHRFLVQYLITPSSS